jgi:hypothetical protein
VRDDDDGRSARAHGCGIAGRAGRGAGDDDCGSAAGLQLMLIAKSRKKVRNFMTSSKSEIRKQKSEIRNQKWKPEIRNQMGSF